MRYPKVFRFLFILIVLLAIGFQDAAAQTSTTGDLTGAVTDPKNQVIPSVKVRLRDLDHGNVFETTTNGAGIYRFSLLSSGNYEVSVDATGFESRSETTKVNLGQVTTLNLKLNLQSTTEKVGVVEVEPLLQTESGDFSSTLTEREIQTMPNQGNDMTYPLEMTAGVTENTLGGYGNYSVNGISATSNLFTINGMDDNDPYLSLNNTGATSLMLGQNEVKEATIVSNGYGGQFGGLAGSNVNFVTKGGENQFHGSATYYWNGRALNANTFFGNNFGDPRTFANANQYGGDIGGRIIKDKLFWYFDTEGIRFVFPSGSGPVLVPDPAFEAATITNLMANHPLSVPFYQNIFKLYNAAATANSAQPGLPSGGGNGCGTYTTDDAGDTANFTLPGVTNCVDNFHSSSTLFTKEEVYAWRIDYNINSADRIFGRVQMDRGFQGSYTDPISPLFNLVSDQPEDQGQLVENHSFGATATNQLIISGQWYAANFNAPNLPAALAAFPSNLSVTGLTTLGGLDYDAPQGRNVTQVQFSDDVTKTIGRHTLKFGAKYRRNDVTDSTYGILTSGSIFVPNLDAFYNGGYDPNFSGSGGLLNVSNYQQTFPSSNEERFKFWNAGGYAEDDIQVKPNLMVTLALRADHASNPTCKDLCFARLIEPFTQLVNDPVLGGANAANVPYDQILTLNNRAALVGLTNIEWAPRFGFAWQPFGRDHSTVIRGGIGIFYDAFPGTVVDNISENSPLYQSFTVGSGASPLLLSPAEANNVFNAASASNSAFLSGFSSGATVATLQAQVPGFVPPALNFTPNFTNVPQYQKWSLALQQGLGKDTSLTITYEGNHGIHEVEQNQTLNAYAANFTGLPTAPPDPRFGYVNGIFTDAISNYNGMSVTVTHRYGSGQITANYTYSHALDEVSNGGFSPYAYAAFYSTNTSPINPQSPTGLRSMYGDADYDVRHYLSLSYLWELPFKRLTFGHGPDLLLKGWEVSGTVLARTGLPFSVVDLTTTGNLDSTNYGITFAPFGPGSEVFATAVPGVNPGKCSGPGSNVGNPCFNTNAFTTSPTAFGNVGRNTMRGPDYFNSDFSVWKRLNVIPRNEKAEFDLGFQFYNVFNHPNFDNPAYDVSNTSTFGILQRTISPSTTVYGSGLGADASPRLIQLKAQFKF